MGSAVLQGDPPIAITLRRSARARRITLRVSATTDQVTLTLPTHVSERAGLDFAREKETWIRGHLARSAGLVAIGPSVILPLEGQEVKVVSGSGRRVQEADGTLMVPGPADRMGARLAGHLKTRARDRLSAASDAYASALGLRYTSLALRDTRSRWGSCSSAGRLMYSWRLIMAPKEVLTYVAAHEVAHLAEMNHSPAFWAVVERLYGDYKAPRRWLHKEGAALHRYRF